MTEVEELRAALAPFARYAHQMRKAWTSHDNSVFYGVKREGASQITYGDFRRASNVYFRTPHAAPGHVKA